MLLAIVVSFFSYFQSGGDVRHLIDKQGELNYNSVPLLLSQDSIWFDESELDLEEKLKYIPDYDYSLILLPTHYTSGLVASYFKKDREEVQLWALYLFNLFCGLLSFYLLSKLLLRHYSIKVSLISLSLLLLASNLLIYLYGVIGHQEVFLLLLVSYILSLYLKQQLSKWELLMGSFSFGLASLMQPALFFLIVIPLFNLKRNNKSLRVILKDWIYYTIPFIFLVMGYASFHYFIIDSLGEQLIEQSYFFLDPKFYRGLLEYRKGWLIYSPIMIFALVGLIVSLLKNRYKNEFGWDLLLFLLFYSFVVFSWWNWWYSDSFGQKVMIPIYGLMLLGIAFLVEAFLQIRNNILGFWIVVFSCFLVLLNVHQSIKYKEGIISGDGMTERLFWASFGADQRLSIFSCLERKPSYKKALNSERLEVFNLCEDQFRLYLQWLVGHYPDGTDRNAPGVVRFKDYQVGIVYYWSVQEYNSIEISLDSDDDYEVRFFLNDQLIAKNYLASNCWFTKGLWNHAYVMDEEVQAGFDKIEIEAMAGDGECAIGQIMLY